MGMSTVRSTVCGRMGRLVTLISPVLAATMTGLAVLFSRGVTVMLGLAKSDVTDVVLAISLESIGMGASGLAAATLPRTL